MEEWVRGQAFEQLYSILMHYSLSTAPFSAQPSPRFVHTLGQKITSKACFETAHTKTPKTAHTKTPKTAHAHTRKATT
eukprot:343033-Chlamydomonas_euryale.AAC.1